MSKDLFKRLAVTILSVLLLLPVFTVNVSAKDNLAEGWSGSGEDSILVDNAGIFDEKTLFSLMEKVQDTSEKLELNIIILLGGPALFMSDSETEAYCNESYDDIFGENSDGIMLFMDFSGKSPAYDYISTSGSARLDYDSRIDNILDSYWDLMPPSTVSDYSAYSSDIAEAVETFLFQLEYYRGKGSGKLFHDEEKDLYIYTEKGETVVTSSKPFRAMLPVLLYAFPVGAVAGVIFFFVTKSHYKFKKSLNSVNYVSRQETNFYRREDRFIRTHTSKTKIETSSGSSGGGGRSGGGGGHSGGSHGGGGRHR